MAVATATALGADRLEAQDETAWVGTFKGTFVTDGPSGNMTLTIGQENKVWKFSGAVEAEGAPPANGDGRDIKVEGNAFEFTQTFGEFDVIFKGTRDGTTIKGTIEAYQAGSMVGSGTFELTKQA
ncbi:MAG TPA: hypothetical protein VGA78_02050 [Gemmatimonadales bacterium]